MGTDERGYDVWQANLDADDMDHFDTNILRLPPHLSPKHLVSERCLLYFPSNRADEPAWLNQANLRAKPQYTAGTRLVGETSRRLIAHSPLRDIHDWLYDVAYDRAVFEIHSPSLPLSIRVPEDKQSQTVPVPLFFGYRGDATNAYNSALSILQTIIPDLDSKADLRFGIGGRHNRIISLQSTQGVVVPNLFQLSSGEMSLLSLFLSVLRDFDLREARDAPFASAQDVKGLVVVDEVDLHLHSKHQYDVLPKLVRMFPRVQFVMTTHSPLFVLGMAKVFGEDGFHIYDLPDGFRIAPDHFREFGAAFLALSATSAFAKAVRTKRQEARRPILFVEGVTDKEYLQCAAMLLDRVHLLDNFQVESVGGSGQLKVWGRLVGVPVVAEKAVVLLHDPESNVGEEQKGNVYKRQMPFCESHPIRKGIENLFDKKTIEKARQRNPKFIDVDPGRTRIVRGEEVPVPGTWSVNKDEKRNLCDWLCEEGTSEDFRHFKGVFDILEQLGCVATPTLGNGNTANGTPSDL